jgi:hypothetical protein
MKLNAENLKNELWITLKEIRGGQIDPKTANAIASQARSIISTVNTEITIQTTKGELSKKVKSFTE